MTRRPCRGAAAIALTAIALTTSAGPALAHEGNPNYRSDIDPPPAGVSASMLNYDDSVELTVEAGHEVIVAGYESEPYLRFRADGTVEVNRRSPSGYLNEDRYGDADVPAAADADAPPEWERVGDHGRYAWHDHRAHYMSKSLPPAVMDESVETKVFDWRVPVELDGRRTAITGTLFWDPADDGGVSPAVAAGLGAAVLASLVLAVWRIRSRRSTGGDADVYPQREAW